MDLTTPAYTISSPEPVRRISVYKRNMEEETKEGEQEIKIMYVQQFVEHLVIMVMYKREQNRQGNHL
jgi:hypothetical protein